MEEFLLPVARQITAKLIGLELVEVKPLSSPSSTIYFNGVFDKKSNRKTKLERIFRSPEWRQHKIEELLK